MSNPNPRPQFLSPRELEILGLIAAGLTSQQIAEELFLARGTVRTHVQSILTQLHVHTRAGAVAIGYQRGWLT